MLRTSRLLLRPHLVTDLERYALLMGTDESQYDPGAMPPLTVEEAWARLLRFVGHWSHFGYGLFIVEDCLTGELIGEVGYAHFQRGVHPDFDTALEGAWRVAVSRRRQGIALEALQTALAWIDQRVHAERTVCMIHPTNGASLKVAARLGYREFTRTRYKNGTVALFERLAPR
jgi:RimJ/RimL family protein N-acetyltransferase